ncbi:unnamed protein product [Spirodela intermedia]|uniref:Protein TIFY n=1 Tax=Spirodela intermedia TaxID=51605 RepID=A0A7I8JNL7_SPIIN|nr:unnamed protein product [Spirodela intermedia]CAA6671764.1 unnamed protein product [Spirodela intermedia]
MGRWFRSGGDSNGEADTELCLRTGGTRGEHCAPPAYADGYGASSSAAPLTIFYGGQISVCYVTEAQARAIIAAAAVGRRPDAQKPQEEDPEGRRQLGVIAAVPPPQQLPSLSMKMSLKRFLQKRKARTAAAGFTRPSPYGCPQEDRCRRQQLQLHLRKQPSPLL